MSGIEYEAFRDLVVCAIGRDNPTDPAWDTYADFLVQQQREGKPPRGLVVTQGGAPTPSQRRLLDARLGAAAASSRVAVLTDSTFARGVVNAFALIQRGYRAFARDDLDEALRFVDVSPSDAPEVRRVMARVEGRLSDR